MKKLNQTSDATSGGRGAAKADGANIRFPDHRVPWGAKHMSRLGGQSNAGQPVFNF